MTDESNFLRREDDRLIGQVLSELKSLSGKVDKFTDVLDELRTGKAQLPQCRENTRRIDITEKKIAQHSYNDLNQRVIILEQDRKEQRATIGWTLKTAIGAIIIGLINLLWGKITQ